MLLSFFPLSAVIFSVSIVSALSAARFRLHLAASIVSAFYLSVFYLFGSLLSSLAGLLTCGRIGLFWHAVSLPISALDMVCPTSRGAAYDGASYGCAVSLRAPR